MFVILPNRCMLDITEITQLWQEELSVGLFNIQHRLKENSKHTRIVHNTHRLATFNHDIL